VFTAVQILNSLKVRLPLRLTKHHAIKIYGAVELHLHAFLTSSLDGGEWPSSNPGHLPMFFPDEVFALDLKLIFCS